jgi:hypothetical protein
MLKRWNPEVDITVMAIRAMVEVIADIAPMAATVVVTEAVMVVMVRAMAMVEVMATAMVTAMAMVMA